jgi:hypothetical protein
MEADCVFSVGMNGIPTQYLHAFHVSTVEGGGVESKKTEGNADRMIECCQPGLPLRHNKANRRLIYL